jgi:outer membrane beta-barrel protein
MMPYPINKILVCLLGLGVTAYSYGDNGNKPVKIIEPDKTVTSVQPAAIDTERFELGAYVGLLSVEDFNTNPVTGFSLSYHINDSFIVQTNYGTSAVGKASFEEREDASFLKDYDFTYVNLLAGYKVLGGRSFLGKRQKFNSAIYLLAGAADVSFNENSKTGIVFGASYRAVITDWLTVNLDVRDTIVDREFLENSKKTNNTEMVIGVNALF